MEKGVHQAHQAEMVTTVCQALQVHLALLAPPVLAGILRLSMILEKELALALDQWV